MSRTEPAKTSAYSWYVLSVLTGVYVMNFVDRQILSILMPSIQRDMQLSDPQLGLLGGVAFAIFYATLGIPIGRLADRWSRKGVIAISLVIWSGMTALSGLAGSFVPLLLARIGVGVGEAGGSPPSHSLISDYFPLEKRASAMAVYATGTYVGIMIGFLAGGWLSELFDWRTAFLLVGLPGVFLAVFVRLTLREPERGQSEPGGAQHAEPQPIGEVVRFMFSLPSFVHLSLAGALHAFVGYGAGLFLPSFFMRIHGFGLAETATYLFLIGLTGMIGTFLGGYLGDRLGVADKRWYAWVPGIATLAAVPFGVAFYLWEDPIVALFLAIPGAILGPMYLGPTFGMTQTLVKPQMRALASAILLFVLNLIGLGLGPLFAGFLSDQLRPEFGVESIRYSLLFVTIGGNLWAAWHYYMASRTLREDLTVKDR